MQNYLNVTNAFIHQRIIDFVVSCLTMLLFLKCNLCEVIYFYLCCCPCWPEVIEKKIQTSEFFVRFWLCQNQRFCESMNLSFLVSSSSSSLVSFPTDIPAYLVSYTFLSNIIRDFLDIWNIFRPTKCFQDTGQFRYQHTGAAVGPISE